MKDLIEQCSKRVWEQLGPGYNEVVYQKALNYELNCNGILTDTERYINAVYKDSKGNKHVVTISRIDILIHDNESTIILELKNINKNISDTERMQVKRYFKELKEEGTCVSYGIIINFPQIKIEKKRDIEMELINNIEEQIVEQNHP